MQSWLAFCCWGAADPSRNHVEFRPDHTMATLMGDDEGRVWTPMTSGIWRLEGNDLVTEEHFRHSPFSIHPPRPDSKARATIHQVTRDKITWNDGSQPYIRVR